MPKAGARPTTKAEVLARLKAEEDPRGIASREENLARAGGLKSHGIGLTRPTDGREEKP